MKSLVTRPPFLAINVATHFFKDEFNFAVYLREMSKILIQQKDQLKLKYSFGLNQVGRLKGSFEANSYCCEDLQLLLLYCEDLLYYYVDYFNCCWFNLLLLLMLDNLP